MEEIVKDTVKYILLGLLTLPFAALITDASGKTDNMMLRVVSRVAAVSVLLALLIGDLHQRPNVADVYGWAFVAWPLLLLIAKGINPSISWRSIWIPVPIMSWYLVYLSIHFYYPTSSIGGGLGGSLGIVAGWAYMMIPFAPMCALFIGIQSVLRRIKTEPQNGAPNL